MFNNELVNNINKATNFVLVYCDTLLSLIYDAHALDFDIYEFYCILRYIDVHKMTYHVILLAG